MDQNKPGIYLITNRCSRQAFALGKGPQEQLYYQRKEWIEEVLLKLCFCYMVRLLEWSIMDNHYHLVLDFDPRRIRDLSNEELAELALALDVKATRRRNWSEKQRRQWVADLLRNKKELAAYRKRLSSLSRFMAYFGEAIAVRCNQEDDVSGHFWAKRFDCVPLADAGAVLAGCLYVSLNPVRAAVVDKLDDVRHTGMSYTLLNRYRANKLLNGRDSLAPLESRAERISAQLCPVEEWFADSEFAGPKLSFEEYVELAEAVGSVQRYGKRGYLKPECVGVLQRFGLKEEAAEHLAKLRELFPRLVGSKKTMMKVAKAMNRSWYRGKSKTGLLYIEEE